MTSSPNHILGTMPAPDDLSVASPSPGDATQWDQSSRLRVCLITTEFHGLFRNGGIGTANTGLALVLAESGFDVTVAFADADEKGPRIKEGNFEELQQSYRELGITLDFVPAYPQIARAFDDCRSASYCTYLYLKQHKFDVVYFNDCGGHGYFSLLAKHVGSFNPAPRIYVVAHGPQEWVLDLNSKFWDRATSIVDYLERRSVELADTLLSPSLYMVDWMRTRGWTIPADVRVIQNIVRLPDSVTPSPAVLSPAPIAEIVFFGRLEVRKGIELFCDAIDLLNQRVDLAGIRVTFMGKFSQIGGLHSGVFLVERARRWRSTFRIIARYDHAEALTYLSRPRVLAVMPSRAENSPCTVAECLQLGVPFLATGSGGTIELVAPEDRDLCLVGATAEELAAKLDLALKHGHRAARLAVTQADARAQWLRLTASKSSEDQSQDEPALHCKTTGGSNDGTATLPLVSICLMHPVPSPGFAELIDSCIGQNYLRLEIVLVEDGVAQQSPTIASLEAERERISVQVLSDVPRDQGAARNAAGTHANGTYLLFVDEGRVVLTPECVEAMVTAAIRTGCDIVSTVPLEFQHLSSWVDSRAGQIKNIPIGACAELGGFENCFGDGVLLVKRSSFERIGGYETPTGREIGDWLFLAKAVLSGLHLEVVPEALFRRGAASHAGLIRSTDVDNRRRILAMYNQKEARAFNRFIESVSTFNGSQNENLEAALNKLHGEARAVAFRISNSLEPNSEDAMRGLVQFCIEQNRISEALDFALCNGWALLSNSIGLAQQAAEAVALDTVRSNTLDLRFEVTLTDDIGQRVQSVSVFPARELARPTGVVASHAIEPGVRILKAAAALPPGTRSVSAIAEIKVSSQTPVSLAIVVSAANASLRLIKDKIESKEGFSWSGWLKLDGSATADLTVTLPGAASKLLDLHFLCKASEDGIYPEGVVTWKTVTANLSANGAVTSSAIEPSEAAKAIPRIVIERGILMTEKVDFPFPLFVPGEQTLVHPLPDRPVLVRIAGAVPQGTIGIRSVVSLELAQAHPVQFAIWAKSPPTTAKLESDFTAKDAFSGWFPVTDKFRRHSFTLNLEEPTTEPMDLYLATRVVGYPDVHFCHAVWHELLILT